MSDHMPQARDDDGEKRAQGAAWSCGGGYFHRINGVDHAVMPVADWRAFMRTTAELGTQFEAKRDALAARVGVLESFLRRCDLLGDQQIEAACLLASPSAPVEAAPAAKTCPQSGMPCGWVSRP